MCARLVKMIGEVGEIEGPRHSMIIQFQEAPLEMQRVGASLVFRVGEGERKAVFLYISWALNGEKEVERAVLIHLGSDVV
jgi:hypothetical protein